MGTGIAILLLQALCCAVAGWAGWQWTRSWVFAVVAALAPIAAFFIVAPEIGILTFIAVVALIAGLIHGGPRRSAAGQSIRGPFGNRILAYALLVVGFAAPIAEAIYLSSTFGAFCDRNSGTRILKTVTNVPSFVDERDGSHMCHYCAAPLYRHVDIRITDQWSSYLKSRLKAEENGVYRLTGAAKGAPGCAPLELMYSVVDLRGRCVVATRIEQTDAPYRIRVEMLEHQTAVGIVKERREVFASADGTTVVATDGSLSRRVGQLWFEGLEMAFRRVWHALAGQSTYSGWEESCPSRRSQPMLTVDKIFPPAR